jgi:tetratricopeptide (TPR) repeat protein
MKTNKQFLLVIPLLVILGTVPSAAQNQFRDQFTACLFAHADTPGAEEGCGTVHSADSIGMGKRAIITGKYSDAIPYLTRAHDDNPHDPTLLTLLAYANEMLGNSDLALMYYKRALDENPNFGITNFYLGRFYLKAHDLNSATAQLNQLASLCSTTNQNYPAMQQYWCSLRNQLSELVSAYDTANHAPVVPPKSTN